MAVTGSSSLDFIIGFVVSLLASIMNAAGLNLLKLDHVRNSSLSPERQRNECGRPMWHVGLYLYVASQLAGSTIALNFLKTQWVAPLGSIALIFNFVFAKILVGTQITKQDVYGTFVVMASVVWIVVFGGMNSAGDLEERLTLQDLKELMSRVLFVIYFSILNAFVFGFLALGVYAYWAISLDDESGQLRKRMKTKLTKLLGTNRFARASGLTLEGDEGLVAEARDLRLRKVVAMIMSACGGLLASQTLLLAKSGVKLITSTLAGQNQFTDNLSYFILFVLVFTAILQVYCLNTALKLYDSVLVVPTFYGFYTAFGLINSTIYLDQLGSYEPWVLLLVLIGIGALIYGVKMLSAPKPEQNTSTGGPLSSLDNTYDEDEDEDAHEMEQRSKSKLGEGKGMGGKGGKKSKLSLKKKASKRQSHQPKLDEENDIPSLYGSRRGILDSDGSSEISTIGGHGSNSRRGTSFTSKSSFQSDPFRTPKDNRSIHEDFHTSASPMVGVPAISAGQGASGTRAGRQSVLFADQDGPTHVLVDTNDSDYDLDERDGMTGAQEALRRQSMLQSSLNALTMHEKPATVGAEGQGLPRIDTAIARSNSASQVRDPSNRNSLVGLYQNPSGMMSPSQFRAQYTNSTRPVKPKHMRDEESAAMSPIDELVFQKSGTTASTAQLQQHQQGLARGHSVRWSTGSSKIDQVFDDLNPFKVLKNNRDSIQEVSSSVPSSPSQKRSQHGRQDSFTGLPSDFDVPGRKKRHSMLFGEAGRSSSSSSLNGESGTSASAGVPPSKRLSRNLSSSSDVDFAAVNLSSVAVSTTTSDGTAEPQKYQNHFFTGTPSA
ncbi:hypothetical protein BGZ74_000141 [Mortierella antarctica]|nr:hypothetical protein BGZ74_000141 [Mortierella antarctica]